MNKNKFLAFAITLPVIAIGAGALLITSTSAQEATQGSSFIEKLAQKLGIDQSTVETAVEAVRGEIRDEIEVKVDEEIASLVTEGTLTQRQADLLNGAQDVHDELRESESIERPSRDEMKDLTEEERKAKMEEFKTQMEQTVVDKLNEKGYNTSVEEFEAAKEAAKEAGLKMMGGHRGGPRGEMGM